MAKKKTDATDDAVVLNEMAQVEKSIMKAYGSGLLIDAQTVIDEPQMVIPLCPALNPVLGGGIPEGSWFILTGEPKVGKTTLLLHFCARCQLEKYGSREIYYLDVEGRLKKMNLTGIKGLNLNKFHIVRSVKGNILSAEAFLDIALQIIENHPGAVVVIDSISALCGANEMSKEMNEATMGGTSIAQGRFVRKAANILPVNKNIIIGITHITSNLGGYGATTREKTSNALAYQADAKLKAVKKEAWKVGEKQIGQIVTWNVVVSALGPPAGVAQSYIRYGQGIDELTELIIMATDLGILNKPEKSAWYTFDYNGEEQKVCGLNGVYEFFASDENRKEYIQNQINEMLL